jgi:hypothetical protein
MKSHQKAGTGIILPLAMLILIASCSKSTTTTIPPPTLVKEWDVVLNARFENPAPAGRSETGTATIQLYDNNTIKYNIALTGLTAGDNLTAAHIHFGNALTNGPVILNFEPSFSAGGSSSGNVTVRSTLVDTLKTMDVYFNVHSTQFPGGLIRGQLNNPVDFAIDVPMVGTNEVPSVTTTATGLALLRLGTDKTLFSKITVTSLEANDTLIVAHIHGAAAGSNGSVLQGLCGSNADFGIVKSVALSDANITALKTGAVYVNAHSKLHPGGIIRGQIR